MKFSLPILSLLAASLSITSVHALSSATDVTSKLPSLDTGALLTQAKSYLPDLKNSGKATRALGLTAGAYFSYKAGRHGYNYLQQHRGPAHSTSQSQCIGVEDGCEDSSDNHEIAVALDAEIARLSSRFAHNNQGQRTLQQRLNVLIDMDETERLRDKLVHLLRSSSGDLSTLYTEKLIKVGDLLSLMRETQRKSSRLAGPRSMTL